MITGLGRVFEMERDRRERGPSAIDHVDLRALRPKTNTAAQLSDLESSLERHIAALDVGELATSIVANSVVPLERAEAEQMLRGYLNESRVALRLVGPELRPECRVLEVGSGIGFFASFLAHHGVDIVELEPVGAGFDFIGAARQILAEQLPTRPALLDIGVESLDHQVHGQFDLVYSLNVLEHLPDWRNALARMSDCLRPGGRIVQSCPNYTVPYEPHFGVPLLPFAPAATARVLPERMTDTDLWRSLNWVTSREVRRWATSRGMTVEFRSGQLADTLVRLDQDPEFRKRHGEPLAAIAGILRRAKLIPVLRRIPVALNTPMEFELRS